MTTDSLTIRAAPSPKPIQIAFCVLVREPDRRNLNTGNGDKLPIDTQVNRLFGVRGVIASDGASAQVANFQGLTGGDAVQICPRFKIFPVRYQ